MYGCEVAGRSRHRQRIHRRIRRLSAAVWSFLPRSRDGYRTISTWEAVNLHGMKQGFRSFIAVEIIILLLTLSEISICKSQIIGMDIPCENEGAKINLQIANGNPCVDCVCKNKVVTCSLRVCPKLSCHVEVKGHDSCCPYTCKGCVLDGNSLESSTSWLPTQRSSCAVQNCKDGIVTKTDLQCHAACDDALPPTGGDCCPSCSGCSYGGNSYNEDEIFSPREDSCIECLCKNGRTTCHRMVCPVLACDRESQRMVAGQCCPICVGSRRLFSLEQGRCWFQRGILQNYEEVRVDKCTECVCKNGTVVCQRETCPEKLDCPRSEWISTAGCCPICSAEHFENCTTATGDNVLHGSSWSKVDNPCSRCLCENGTVTCSEEKCPKAELKCPPGQVSSRVPGRCCEICIKEPGICTVFGDPHYRTFDGRPFNFQGSCKYLLAKDCLYQRFSVIVQNDAKKSRSISWTKEVYLDLNVSGVPLQISLHQRLVAKIDGRKIALPYFNPHTAIFAERGFIKVRTTQGVLLNWDGDSYLEVGVSPTYRSSLCGLCGNFNGFTRDDFVGGDGFFKFDKNQFADSWKVGTSEDCTRPNYSVRLREPCDKSVAAKLRARQKCSVFKSAPFHPCYNLVDPTEYYKSCLTDACECPRNKRCVCESIRAYSSACARRGIKIQWNKNFYCKKTCRRGKVYSICGPACKVKCRNYKNTKRNKRCERKPCVAGCHCPAGYVLHKSRCIKPTSCPKRSKSSVLTERSRNPFESILLRSGV